MAAAIGIGDSTIVQLTGSLLVATLGVVAVPRLARAPRSEYPRHEVFYFDPVANDVREEERISEIASYPEYLRVVFRHPAEMAAQIEYPIDDAAGATRSLASEDLQWAGARNDDEAFALQGRPNVGHGGLDAELSREDPADLIAVDVRDPIHSLGALG